jgi:hypothetical protein
MKPLSPYLSLISNQVQAVEPTFEKTLKERVRELLNLEHYKYVFKTSNYAKTSYYFKNLIIENIY